MSETKNSSCCCGSDHAGTTSCCGGGTATDKKHLQINYLYLDLDSCNRCIGTDAVLDTVVNQVRPVLSLAGYDVEYEKIKIETPELAAQYHFISSPTIQVNGRDIFEEVEESDCGCCGEIAGTDVNCRVFRADGKSYEVPTEEMLADAILKSLSVPPAHKTPYVLPENLRRFFEGNKENETKMS